MDLFIIKKPHVKEAGKAINEDPATWNTEVAKAMANEHSYASLQGAQIKMQRTDPGKGTAFGAIVFPNGSGAFFSIRPEPTRGKPELDPIDVLYDPAEKRLMHFNRTSYGRVSDTSPSVVERNENQNYAPPGGNPNPYIGQQTGDVSPLPYGVASNQGLSGGSSTNMRMASCGLISKFVQSDEYLARLNDSLSNFSGLSRAAEIYGLKDSLGPVGMPRSVITGRGSNIVITRHGMKFWVHFENGLKKPITTHEIEALAGSSRFHDAMQQLMASNRIILENNTVLETVDMHSLESHIPTIEVSGPHYVQISGDVSIPMQVYTETIGFDGTQAQKTIAFHADGVWILSDLLKGVPCAKACLYTSVMINGNQDGARERVAKDFNKPNEPFVGGFRFIGSNNKEDRHIPQEGAASMKGFYGGYRERGYETLQLLKGFCSEKPSPMAPGHWHILNLPSLNSATLPFKIVRYQEIKDDYPLVICESLNGKKFAFKNSDSIGRPQFTSHREGALWGLDMPVYLVPSAGTMVWVCGPTPLKITDSSYMQEGTTFKYDDPDDKLRSMLKLKVVKTASDAWLVNGEQANNELHMFAKIAANKLGEEVALRASVMEVGEELDLRYKIASTFSGSPEIALSSEQKKKLVKVAGRLGDVFRRFRKAANDLAEGADQTTKENPEAFNSETIDGILSMQVADQDTMIKIVESESEFKRVEHHIAQLLMAARAGKESLNEKGLARALRGIGEANQAISQIKIELQSEGVL